MKDDARRRSAFEKSVRENAAMVARIAASYERRPALQDELVQDAFAALWKAMPRFQEKSSVKTYVARITHNVCISHVRRETKTPMTTDLNAEIIDKGADPEADAALARETNRLMEAVRALPFSLRQVVTLHLEDFTDREIAEALDLSVGAVAVRLSRARSKLKVQMGAVS
ncbi:MAG: sigma-70 family RNA polymerase sigma factor [Pseudomonadota bacterium]